MSFVILYIYYLYPIKMENNNELNNLTCQIKDHSNLKIIGFCIDPNCNSNNKFACQECFF